MSGTGHPFPQPVARLARPPFPKHLAFSEVLRSESILNSAGIGPGEYMRSGLETYESSGGESGFSRSGPTSAASSPRHDGHQYA